MADGHLSQDEVIALINQTDAQVWAEAFQRTFKAILGEAAIESFGTGSPPELPIDDTGWLIGWFANAIQAGYTQRERTRPVMTGYEIADAMDRGDMVFVQFLTGADGAWFLADEHNADYPDGTPSSWWREHVGQIAVAAYATERIGDPIPDMEPVSATTDLPGRVSVTIRNVPNDGP